MIYTNSRGTGSDDKIKLICHKVAVMQWITSHHKNRMTTRIFERTCNVVDKDRVSNAFSY